ncbi:MAG: hypothetical protein HQL34_08655 [Alphaproteobacteria bacterium]|nr:hypothetical protein [Alphaproteobacteria bacterium]
MKSRTPLSALIGPSVRLIRQGREFTGLCPFHVEDTPSFTINDDKGFYHCFGCSAHGDHLDYLQERHGMTFPEAVRTLADGSGVTPEVQATTLPRSRQAEAVWTPVLPVPADVPPLVSAKSTAKGVARVYNPKRAGTDKDWATLRPEMTYAYRTIDGTLLGYVLRCTFSDGGKFTPQVT